MTVPNECLQCVIGIDPGPAGFAWAAFDGVDITQWGEVTIEWDAIDERRGDYERNTLWPMVVAGIPNVVAIEKPMVPYEGVAKGQKFTTGPAIDTAQVVGLLRIELARTFTAPTILVPRPTVKAALPGCDITSNEARVNAVMKKLCPALDQTVRGLNTHTRAAAALAYVARGQYQKQRLTQLAQ